MTGSLLFHTCKSALSNCVGFFDASKHIFCKDVILYYWARISDGVNEHNSGENKDVNLPQLKIWSSVLKILWNPN